MNCFEFSLSGISRQKEKQCNVNIPFERVKIEDKNV